MVFLCCVKQFLCGPSLATCTPSLNKSSLFTSLFSLSRGPVSTNIITIGDDAISKEI
jgi:hypothetical protein